MWLIAESAEANSITSQIPRLPGKKLPYTFSVSVNVCSANGIEKVESNCALSPLQYLKDDTSVAQVTNRAGGTFALVLLPTSIPQSPLFVSSY